MPIGMRQKSATQAGGVEEVVGLGVEVDIFGKVWRGGRMRGGKNRWRLVLEDGGVGYSRADGVGCGILSLEVGRWFRTRILLRRGGRVVSMEM